MKGAGAAGIYGLAGCIGGNGGGGGLTEVSMVYPPWAGKLVLDYVQNQTSILPDALEEAGYTLSVTESWDDTTLFASGQVDFMPTMADIEGAVFGVEREIEVAMHGMASPNYEGLYVRRGSEVDPENTGSVEASIQMMVDEGRPFGHAGYNEGAVWPAAAIFNDRFDLTYVPGESDFNLQQADWFTLPDLLVNGDVDMVINAPILGMDKFLTEDPSPVKDILWFQPEMQDIGIPPENLNLGMFGTRLDFSDEHEDFISAFMGAWKQGAEWISDPSIYPDILENEDNWSLLTAETRAEAEININFAFQNEHSENLVPLTVRDIELTEEKITQTEGALNKMVELGILNENWSDWVTFKSLPVGLE